MATRQIIEIDQEKCNGCGACETGCPEGALRIIDGKARLVGENLCDGLGACMGNCPIGAIRVIEREAEPYDENLVMSGIHPQGPKVVAAHFDHLRRHGQDHYVRQAMAWLESRGLPLPPEISETNRTLGESHGIRHACPGSAARRFTPATAAMSATARPLSPRESESGGKANPGSASALSHWPIQLHLVNPRARHFERAKLLVAADCTAFALGSFHPELLEGRSLVIACPKLDEGRESYLEKLSVLIGSAETVTIAIMEVPCCSGLLKMVLEARERLSRHVPVAVVIVGIEGGFVARKSY